ncbi:MAG: hypothetical protein AAGF73_04460 [Actinomycetota bacterium]
MGVTIRTDFDQAAACQLYGLDADQIVERFANTTTVGHWFAYDELGNVLGVAVAAQRPDRRVFLTHRLAAEHAYEPLLLQALATITRPVNVSVRDDQHERLALVRRFGLEHELTNRAFEVRFDRLLETLPAPRATADFSVAPVSDVDPDQLYELDIALRSDVPGNDGWQGNRAWFDDELAASECDPTGYLVALDHGTGRLIGLCRMWRNPDGPSLGMLGVRRERRNGFVALRLLHNALTAASDWGSPTFLTHTARSGLQRHLHRAEAVERGASHRFVRR